MFLLRSHFMSLNTIKVDSLEQFQLLLKLDAATEGTKWLPCKIQFYNTFFLANHIALLEGRY